MEVEEKSHPFQLFWLMFVVCCRGKLHFWTHHRMVQLQSLFGYRDDPALLARSFVSSQAWAIIAPQLLKHIQHMSKFRHLKHQDRNLGVKTYDNIYHLIEICWGQDFLKFFPSLEEPVHPPRSTGFWRSSCFVSHPSAGS